MNETPGQTRPEGIAGVLGTGFLLVLLVGAGLSAVLQRTASLAPSEVFAGWFVPAALPFGFELLDAARQPKGETLLRAGSPDAPAEAERVKPAPVAAPSKSKTGGPPPYDWGAIAIGPENAEPIEALFATWPLAIARKQVPTLFAGGTATARGSLREQSRGHDLLAGMDASGGRRILEAGRLPWGEFEAPFMHERKFEAGGTFVDTVRVNLSSEREALVLFLRWPRGLPASTRRAEEFLAGLQRVVAP